MDRRSFFRGGLIVLATPAIVRAESLMKVVKPYHLSLHRDFSSFIFDQDLINLIRRRMPELMAYDFIGIIPRRILPLEQIIFNEYCKLKGITSTAKINGKIVSLGV